MRRPGIEPGSTAWKAAMLTIIPPTLRHQRVYYHWRTYLLKVEQGVETLLSLQLQSCSLSALRYCHGLSDWSIYVASRESTNGGIQTAGASIAQWQSVGLVNQRS